MERESWVENTLQGSPARIRLAMLMLFVHRCVAYAILYGLDDEDETERLVVLIVFKGDSGLDLQESFFYDKD